MVVSIQSHDIMEFVAVRENRRGLYQLDGKSGYTEMANRLLAYAHDGGRVLFAVDGAVLAGCFGYSPVTETAACYSPEFLAELGEGARPVFRHNIWVRPEYRGRGLGQQMFAAHIDEAISRGYTHSVGFMPQTEEIARWVSALPVGITFMAARDRRGGKIACKRLV